MSNPRWVSVTLNALSHAIAFMYGGVISGSRYVFCRIFNPGHFEYSIKNASIVPILVAIMLVVMAMIRVRMNMVDILVSKTEISLKLRFVKKNFRIGIMPKKNTKKSVKYFNNSLSYILFCSGILGLRL